MRSETRYYARGSVIADSRERANGLMVVTSGQARPPVPPVTAAPGGASMPARGKPRRRSPGSESESESESRIGIRVTSPSQESESGVRVRVRVTSPSHESESESESESEL